MTLPRFVRCRKNPWDQDFTPPAGLFGVNLQSNMFHGEVKVMTFRKSADIHDSVVSMFKENNCKELQALDGSTAPIP